MAWKNKSVHRDARFGQGCGAAKRPDAVKLPWPGQKHGSGLQAAEQVQRSCAHILDQLRGAVFHRFNHALVFQADIGNLAGVTLDKPEAGFGDRFQVGHIGDLVQLGRKIKQYTKYQKQ